MVCNGGNVGFGGVGIVGSVGTTGISKRWRAAKLTLLLASNIATTKDRKRKQ